MGKVTRKNDENVKKVKEVLHIIRTTQEEKQAKGQEREREGIHVNDKKPESDDDDDDELMFNVLRCHLTY